MQRLLNSKVLWPVSGLKNSRRRRGYQNPEMVRAVGTELWLSLRHEGAPEESQPSSSLCSHRGQPLWSQSRMNSEWCIRTANGIFLLGCHVDLLPSSSLILQLYSEHNLNIFHSCLILLLYYHTFLLRRRQWHPTPVLLPGKSHGQRSLEGCSPWDREESDMTDRLHFHFHFHALEKEMATHSSILAWRIPGTGEPGRLPSMGSHRMGHFWSDLAAAAACSYLFNEIAK